MNKHTTTNHSLHGRDPKQKRPTAQSKKGPRPKKPQRAIKPPAPVPLGRTSISLEGRVQHRETPRLEGVAPLQRIPPLDRGPWPLGRVLASLEGPNPSSRPPPRSRSPSARGVPPAPPTGAINALTHRGCPCQKRIPIAPTS
jgi:hypothetical protein